MFTIYTKMTKDGLAVLPELTNRIITNEQGQRKRPMSADQLDTFRIYKNDHIIKVSNQHIEIFKVVWIKIVEYPLIKRSMIAIDCKLVHTNIDGVWTEPLPNYFNIPVGIAVKKFKETIVEPSYYREIKELINVL